ncbi:MAG TPA: cellulase family glycosylhydrolase [Candidatus Limnocylindria bacterium]|nr:cellulase family glycosylhydrolase [Candidatus Limnocylindria bacterium]
MSRKRFAATLAALCVLAVAVGAPSSFASAAAELSPVHVEGNRLVDSSGRSVTLRGIDRSGTEYMCAQDAGIFDGPIDVASVVAMRVWRANAVRLPLNEHCWLGIDDGAPTPLFVGEAYRQAIESYVDLLVANGLYVILDLHWAAPAGTNADRLRPMPNTSYSALFWTSVADRFKHDGRVIFDLYNEPVPNSNQNDASDDAARRSWECWRDGGAASCDATLTLGNPATAMAAGETVGMQALVDAVRASGASNVIMLGGIQFANTLWSNAARNWLAYRPADPVANVVASAHIYPGTWCMDVSCYDREIAPVAAQVPVVIAEFGAAGCDSATVTWLETLMSWLDAKGSGYLAWTWDTPHSGHDPCTVIKLLLAYDGTATPFGQVVRDHLAALPVATATTLAASAPSAREGDLMTFTTTVESAFGVPTGVVDFAIDGQALTATLDAAGRAAVSTTFVDNGAHQVVARYAGAAGFDPSASAAVSLIVENVSPTVGAVSGPADPVAVGTPLNVIAPFTDPGAADTHTATIEWGDATASSAAVVERDGSGSISGSHAYAAAGVYRVGVSVADKDGGIGRSALDMVVVFDPAAGSARGAGWFESPVGALTSDASASGRASFGFLARYGKDATSVVAHPGFRLRVAGFDFESTAYDWLVITGAEAQLRGAGRVNGSGAFSFQITAIDKQALGSSEPDRLRIRIWDSASGLLVYDNGRGAPDGAEPTSVLGGGSIAVGRGGG